jgi:hypothetical protein
MQLSCDLYLAQEALGPERGSEIRPEHLDGDLAAVLQVLGQVHGSHTAATELPLDGVLIGQGCLEAVQKVGQEDDSGSRRILSYVLMFGEARL